MNKKMNTVLFLIGGTVFNIIVTIVCFLIFLLAYSNFLYGRVSESVAAWLLPMFFAGAIAASFFIYRLVIKLITKKIDMEKYFDPIFARRYKKPKDTQS